MDAPISASQGAMRSLPRKLELVLSGPKHELRAEEKKKLRVLQADLQGLIDNYLIEPSEVVSPASTAHSWMKDVRDLSYDIDDFIFELAHVIIGGGARISVIQKPPRFKICRFPEKLRRRRWVTDEISRFRTRVKEAIRLHQECLGNCKWRPSSSGQPPPTPCDRLVGVDSSIQQLCGLLANDGQPEHRVVSIVGTAGVGKTTLATEVYRKLRGQFQCLAFVQTSTKTDMKGLLTSLLSQVRRQCHIPDALDVHKLVVNINEHLRDKTYLIVIEDLWALSTWDLVNRALPKGNWCSRILMTTEADVIAQTCSADSYKCIPAKKEDNSIYMPSEKHDKPEYMPSREENDPMCMPSKNENYSRYIIKKEPLNEDESRELFSNRAFGKQAKCPQSLEEVSNEIIKRSGGLPLGINILAGLLAHHPASSIEQWSYIQDSLSSDVTADSSSEKINQVLKIGYDHLPRELKGCMLYLCLYEEDCIIWKDDLVKQWIAEGFISAVRGDDEEEVARSYFGELVNRGMIQPVDINSSDEILSCRVHNMVLHFIRDKSMEENFCIVVDHSQTTIRLSDKVRRLALHLGNVEGATPPGPESMRLSKVRSVAFSGFHKCMPSIQEFRFLQILNLKLFVDPDKLMSHNLTGSDDMSGNLGEPDAPSYNLTEVSELFRLRYFHLDACHMSVSLPTQMQQLKDLVAWEIDAEVTAVPSDIVDLPGLLYLRIPREAHLPTGFGRMTSLRTLGVFDLSKNSSEDVMSLGELTSLQDLHLTCSTIQPDNLERNLECLGSVIRKLSNLKCVTLVPVVSSHVNTQNDPGASSMSTSWHGLNIVPLTPLLLQKLELSRRCCHFSSLPEWTKELTKLCILKIAVRKVSQEDVVILKGLPSLTALSLFVWTAPSVRIIFDNEGFSVLKYFKFVCAAPCLEFLDGAMPNVGKLKLGFNANKMDEIAGLKCLTGINEISIKIGGPDADECDRKSAPSVLTEAIGIHPSTPIINVRWVDWNFCGDDENHVEPRKERGDQTGPKHNVTAVESTNLFLEKEARPVASASIDVHSQTKSSNEHGIQEKNLGEDGKKQTDTRTPAALGSTFLLRNTDRKLSLIGKHTDGVAEKHKIDSGGYGEIDKVEKIVRNLEDRKEDLIAKRKDVNQTIENAEREGKIPTNEVKRWLEKGDVIICEVDAISPNYQLKKDVTMEAAEKLIDVKECLGSSPSTISVESGPRRVIEMPGPCMSAEDHNLQEALNFIKDDPTGMIGIWGPGGVGKTHLLNNINNSLDGDLTFDYVVYVTASRGCSVKKIQADIVCKLKLREDNNPESQRCIIFDFLKKKSFLVLLDDLWDRIDLEAVGIPYPLGTENQLKRKVVLTTRSVNVCGQMEVREDLKVAYMQEDEAWQLFQEKVGLKTLSSSPRIEALAKELVKELQGLPLALVTIGRAMYGKTRTAQWEYAVQHMRKSRYDKDDLLGMEKDVFLGICCPTYE